MTIMLSVVDYWLGSDCGLSSQVRSIFILPVVAFGLEDRIWMGFVSAILKFYVGPDFGLESLGWSRSPVSSYDRLSIWVVSGSVLGFLLFESAFSCLCRESCFCSMNIMLCHLRSWLLDGLLLDRPIVVFFHLRSSLSDRWLLE